MNKGSAIFLLILLAGIVIYFVYFYDKPSQANPITDFLEPNKTIDYPKINVYLQSDNKDLIYYRVANSTLNGTLHPNLLEEFKIYNISNLTIYTYGDKYYLTKNDCKVTASNVKCNLESKKRGDLSITNSQPILAINTNSLILNLTLCAGLSFDVTNFNLNLNKTNIPSKLKNYADYCYYVGNLTNEKIVTFNYEGTPTSYVKLYSFYPYLNYEHNGTETLIINSSHT